MKRIASLVLQVVALVATAVLVFAFAGATYFEMTGGRAHLLPGLASLVFGLLLLLQHTVPGPRTADRFLSLGAALGLVVIGALGIRGVVRGGVAGSILLGVLSVALLPRSSADTG